ncbi:MAG: hypothetical protein ACW96U_00740 [Candidatus Heimdallarchaeaceae archaeon]|jgi:predicted RNA-binding Zn-ribbon protein involved in translation (DUF1610 family)
MKLFKGNEFINEMLKGWEDEDNIVSITDELMDVPCPNCRDKSYHKCRDSYGAVVEAQCINCGHFETVDETD